MVVDGVRSGPAAIRYGIALGSNLPQRIIHLWRARRALLALPGAIPRSLRLGRLYQTEPVGCPPDSPAFLNTVIELRIAREPLDLLEETQAIERVLGREPAPGQHLPRTVDIDLLYADEVELDTERLILPHPRMAERLFVMQPLSDFQPILQLLGWQETAGQIAQRLAAAEGALPVFMKEW